MKHAQPFAVSVVDVLILAAEAMTEGSTVLPPNTPQTILLQPIHPRPGPPPLQTLLSVVARSHHGEEVSSSPEGEHSLQLCAAPSRCLRG
jgi:hypothetical protein